MDSVNPAPAPPLPFFVLVRVGRLCSLIHYCNNDCCAPECKAGLDRRLFAVQLVGAVIAVVLNSGGINERFVDEKLQYRS
jgi:hypothetical protein